MKQKILLFVNEYQNIINFRLNIIKYLRNKNYSLEIICYSKKIFDHNKISDQIKGVPCHFINGNSKSKNILNEFLNICKLFVLLKKIKPNFILSFTIKPNLYSSFLSKLLKIKCALTITGLGSTYIENSLTNSIIFKLFRLFRNNYLFFIFQNKSDMKVFQNNNLLNFSNNYLIPGSGVNLKIFSKNLDFINQYDGKQFSFLFIGRLIIHKGIEEFYDAALKLISCTKIKIKFTIIGHYDPKDRYSISKKLYFEMLKNKNFKIIDYTENVVPHILNSNCVLLTSKREGLPMSLLEAGAIGRPIIASNVPGCKEIVINDFNGYLYSSGNVDDLYNKMHKIVNLSKDSLLKFSNNSYMHVSNNFSSSIVDKKYHKIIKDLI